jgi:hypothetical protein
MPAEKSAKKTSPRSRPRHNPFERALAAAATRFEKAINDRALCIERLALLNVEIPQLERTIAVLHDQIVPAGPSLLGTPAVDMIPVAHLAGLPADLSGMASIPISQNEISDLDDGLPELEDQL